PHFKEFTVNFDGASATVKEVNEGLMERGIIGGKPLKDEFKELGETALYCVTEMHTKQDIDNLYSQIAQILGE
ncbi:MAG: aminomethyl-transferring glycine dehydrogenase, partial [Candidatus Bathyarchaeia archaeon]